MAQERDPEVGGERRPPAGAEQLVAFPVVSGEPAHVLDHAAHGELEPAGGERRALGHPLRRRLRRRHDDDLRPGHDLGQGEGDVAGPGRHVDEHEVRLAPVGVGQELLDRLVQHRAAPDHRLVVGHEVTHGQALDAVGRGRDHHVADDDRVMVGPEHLGHREAVDVGVEQPDLVAGLGQRDGQVHRDRRLADAALARRHADDARLRVRRQEGGQGCRRRVAVPVCRVVVARRRAVGGLDRPAPQALPEPGPLLVGHHHEVELDLLDARRPGWRRGGSPRPARRCPARPPRAGPRRCGRGAGAAAPNAPGRGRRASGRSPAPGPRSVQPRAVIGLLPCTSSSRVGSRVGALRARARRPRHPSSKG